MNIAKLDKSKRLQRVLKYLIGKGRFGCTTREIVKACNVVAVNSIISEIRRNGLKVACKLESRDADGSATYRYTLGAA